MSAPQFRDLSEFMAEAEPIRLPIGGTVYEFPGSVSGRTGLLLTSAWDAALSGKAGGAAPAPDAELAELLTDDQEKSVHAELFGGTDVQLARDGHDSRVIRHVFLTLVTWHTAGPEAAVLAWDAAGNAPAPNRATRRAGSRTASGAGASKTRRAASTSGTSRTATATRRPASGGSPTSSRGGR